MDESRIIELYAKYDNCRQVAEELGTSNESVRRVLIKNGIKRTGNRPKRQHKTGIRRPSNCNTTYCGALVVMMRENLGMPTNAIREQTGIPTNAIVNILNRKRPDLKLKRCQRLDDSVINAIEREYIAGVSTYEIGKKYGVHHATVSSLMVKRGHWRGKGNGAVRRINQARHDEAVRKFFAEFGSDITSNSIRHAERRRIRMENAPRDYGITWKALAKRNNSMKCEICGIECDPNDKRWGSSGPTHPSVDHVIEICKGGTDTWDNVRLACCACNIGRNKVIANA